MKTIAVVSDIHGNLIALEEVVEDIERRGVDLVLNLGDHVSGPLWPKETLDFLKAQDWVHIRGNHERQLLTTAPEQLGLSDHHAYHTLEASDLEWLRSLPERDTLGSEMLLVHGSPINDLYFLLETIENGRARLASPEEIKARLGAETTPVILCGHSHIPRVVSLPTNQLLVNPGSVGLPAYDDEDPEPVVIETGSHHARYAILEKHGEQWHVELVAVSYDYHRAIEQARKNGREDWAVGLNGFMS